MLVCPSDSEFRAWLIGEYDEFSNVEKTTEGVMRMRLSVLDTASAILPLLYSGALSSEHDRSGER